MIELNNEIRKSLIDREIKSGGHNPRIVVNEKSKTIKERIKKLLAKSERVDIAVSYVVWSGLSLIYDDLKKFSSTSRLILTTEGMVTDIRSLQRLMELDMQVKVYYPQNGDAGFHLKTYLFEGDNENTLLIGSANISGRAFGVVHEMAVEINSEDKGYIVEEYKEVIDSLWNDPKTEKLSQELIDRYTEIYNEKKKAAAQFKETTLAQGQITPNFMQEKALKELEKCRAVNDRGLVIAATGTGKTYLSAFDVRNSQSKKTLFLVHNRLIMTDAIKTYTKVFPGKKIVELTSQNRDQLESSEIVFTTDKTAANLLMNKVNKQYFDYIVYDEAHKVGQGTKYSELIDYFEPKFSLGITATPERTDDSKYLFRTFDYVVPYEIRLLEALEHELVCPFTYYGVNIENELLEFEGTRDYKGLAEYIKKLIDQKGHYGEKLKALTFCKDIKEAKRIAEALCLAGIKSVSATSDDAGRTEIEEYIEELKSDEKETLEMICVVDKFNEGVDIPDVNTIVMLRNTQSSIIYLQQLGRGLRRTSDPNKYVTIFDIIGNSEKSYSIAQVLTGNETVDKRKLYQYANEGFDNVSPFINVEMEEKAIEKIFESLSKNFKVETEIKQKFQLELGRFEMIPSLKELYLNPNFKELELLQLLFKNFYDPFEKYYKEKYDIELSNKFVGNFFSLISQFVFRSYNQKDLKDYVKILKGELIENERLLRILLPLENEYGIKTAINSEYNKAGKNYPTAFLKTTKGIMINQEVIEELKRNNAYGLFQEHVELFEYISLKETTPMKLFELVTKAEFLYNVGSEDCYMNAIGEREDKENKTVYCAINISDGKGTYDNTLLDGQRLIYHTQTSKTKEEAEKKIQRFLSEEYTFYICAQFPHLGYSNTSFFNLGKVKILNVVEGKGSNKGTYQYNHEIEFELERSLPTEFMMDKAK